jgi:hypothetical protein
VYRILHISQEVPIVSQEAAHSCDDAIGRNGFQQHRWFAQTLFEKPDVVQPQFETEEPEEFSIGLRPDKQIQLIFKISVDLDAIFLFDIHRCAGIQLLILGEVPGVAAPCGECREHAHDRNKQKSISQGESCSHLFPLVVRNRLERKAEEFVEIDREHDTDTCLDDIPVNSTFVRILSEHLQLPAAILGEFV